MQSVQGGRGEACRPSDGSRGVGPRGRPPRRSNHPTSIHARHAACWRSIRVDGSKERVGRAHAIDMRRVRWERCRRDEWHFAVHGGAQLQSDDKPKLHCNNTKQSQSKHACACCFQSQPSLRVRIGFVYAIRGHRRLDLTLSLRRRVRFPRPLLPCRRQPLVHVARFKNPWLIDGSCA